MIMITMRRMKRCLFLGLWAALCVAPPAVADSRFLLFAGLEETVGVVVDVGLEPTGRHVLAIDAYLLSESGYGEQFDRPVAGPGEQRWRSSRFAEEVRAIGLGYRYYFPFGLSIGGQMATVRLSRTTRVERAPFEADDEDDEDFPGSVVNTNLRDQQWTPMLTLGYARTWASGFTLGAHYVRSLPVDFSSDEAEENDFYADAFGMIIGRAW